MLDIKRIKDDPEAVKAGLRAKEVDCDAQIDRILELDAKRRALILQSETSKAEQNRVSKEIPVRKKAGEDVAPIFKRMAELKAAIAEDAKLKADDAALAKYFSDNMGTEDYSTYEEHFGRPYVSMVVLSELANNYLMDNAVNA